ncbi:unnamed protein product, partial [Closterium sp. Naga37s-1]
MGEYIAIGSLCLAGWDTIPQDVLDADLLGDKGGDEEFEEEEVVDEAFEDDDIRHVLFACDAQGRDALKYEGPSFDTCGGHPSPFGQYHYHVAPGVANPSAISTSRTTDFQLCS